MCGKFGGDVSLNALNVWRGMGCAEVEKDSSSLIEQRATGLKCKQCVFKARRSNLLGDVLNLGLVLCQCNAESFRKVLGLDVLKGRHLKGSLPSLQQGIGHELL